MKHILRRVVLFCVTLILLSGTASANSAPPDYLLLIKVANAPEEPYYLDILAPDNMGIVQDISHLAGENNVFQYRDSNMPINLQIRMTTQSGEVWISDTIHRRAVQDSVKVDWSAKSASLPSMWLAAALQTLSTLLPTLAIEGLLLLAFQLEWRKNWKIFLFVNLVTQGALAAYLSSHIVRSGFGSYGMLPYSFLLILPELFIAFAEALIYDRCFQGRHTARRAFLYGLTANAVSFIAGLFTVRAVWEKFVRVIWLGV